MVQTRFPFPSLIFGFALVGAFGPAVANDTSFFLVNNSGETIFEVNISPVDASGWGKDLLGEDVIAPRGRRPFDMGSSNGCSFDIRVKYESKKEEERRKVDLCKTDQVVFGGSVARPSASSQQGQPPRQTASAPRGELQLLECNKNVDCSSKADVVGKLRQTWMQLRAYPEPTKSYADLCFDALKNVDSFHPSIRLEYGNVSPQLNACNGAVQQARRASR